MMIDEALTAAVSTATVDRVADGEHALRYLRHGDGVVILTTSAADTDVMSSYQHRANAFVTKPMDLDAFETVVRQIDRFYAQTAVLADARGRCRGSAILRCLCSHGPCRHAASTSSQAPAHRGGFRR